jgi:UDP-glucose 4-epimerase
LKRCLVTGASGLIGSRLILNMDDDWFVFGLSRGYLDGLNGDRVRHVAVDLSKSWDTGALPEQIDAVIHLAQSEHFRDFPQHAEEVCQVNTVSTLRLLDYARRAGARTFVLASSGGIYGSGDQQFSEEMEISSRGDLGFYLGTKLCSEVIAESYVSFMNVIILRFFFVYGPGQSRGMLIPRLVQSVMNGKPITLQGNDGIRINPTYVDDAAVAIKQSLEISGSHKVNVGGPEVLSLRDIGETIGQAVGRRPNFSVQANSDPRHLVGDIRKMSKLLGQPEVRFRDGIRGYLREVKHDEYRG